MKKAILAVCAATIILACSLLTPATVYADGEKGCVTHTMNGTHEGTMVRFAYNHQYLIKNGPTGPIWGSCAVYCCYDEIYQRCTVCGYIDYDHPVSSVFMYVDHHSACGL